MYVKSENNPYSFINQKNNKFQNFLKLSKYNINVLASGQGKFKEYNDLKKYWSQNEEKLITGINGMDGSHLADFLLEKGYEVFGMERRTSTPNRTNTTFRGKDNIFKW